MSKIPVILGGIAAAGLVFFGLRKVASASTVGGSIYNDCLSRCMSVEGWTPLDCDAICRDPGSREQVRDEVVARWCSEHPDEPTCSAPEGLRQLPSRQEPLTEEEYAQMMELAAQYRAERADSYEQAAASNTGVPIDVYALIDMINRAGVPDSDQRRSRLESSGVLRSMRSGLGDHVESGAAKFDALGYVSKVEAVKDWLSLRRTQRIDNYSWRATWELLTARVAQGVAQPQEIATIAIIEGNGWQNPQFFAFVDGWIESAHSWSISPVITLEVV